jgi:hypothetical protein
MVARRDPGVGIMGSAVLVDRVGLLVLLPVTAFLRGAITCLICCASLLRYCCKLIPRLLQVISQGKEVVDLIRATTRVSDQSGFTSCLPTKGFNNGTWALCIIVVFSNGFQQMCQRRRPKNNTGPRTVSHRLEELG